jgi:hypothetical protein
LTPDKAMPDDIGGSSGAIWMIIISVDCCISAKNMNSCYLIAVFLMHISPWVMPSGMCSKIGREGDVSYSWLMSLHHESINSYHAPYEQEIDMCTPQKSCKFLWPSDHLSASGSGGHL